MYWTREYQANKTRKEYIMLLGRFYPEDKDEFRHYSLQRLKAIYISMMNKRMKLV